MIDNNDLISREALKKAFEKVYPLSTNEMGGVVNKRIYDIIDNAPTCNNLQSEYVDISKLRLMTVEECAGHTIEYAMGWKACIDWLKKGGADNEHL